MFWGYNFKYTCADISGIKCHMQCLKKLHALIKLLIGFYNKSVCVCVLAFLVVCTVLSKATLIAVLFISGCGCGVLRSESSGSAQ